MNKYEFQVSGLHCKSCEILIEDFLSESDLISESVLTNEGESYSLTIVSDKFNSREELKKYIEDLFSDKNYIFS